MNQNYIMARHNNGDGEIKPIIREMQQPVAGLIKYGDGDWKTYTKADGLQPLKKGIQDAVNNGNIINWGNHIFKNRPGFKVNLPESIPNASHKPTTRRMLQDADPNMVPRTWFYGDNNFVFPMVARPPKHYFGHDFHLLMDFHQFMELGRKEDLREWYFAEYFDKTNEYRVHVANGRVMAIREKPLRVKEGLADNDLDWIYIRWGDYKPKVVELAIKAVRILGLHYAGVDVMWKADDKTAKICEVNTNPGIDDSPYMTKKYASYFDWLIRHDFPDPIRFDPKDTVFTTNMLAE